MTSNEDERCYMNFDWLREKRRANQISCNINFCAFDVRMKKVYCSDHITTETTE